MKQLLSCTSNHLFPSVETKAQEWRAPSVSLQHVGCWHDWTKGQLSKPYNLNIPLDITLSELLIKCQNLMMDTEGTVIICREYTDSNILLLWIYSTV